MRTEPRPEGAQSRTPQSLTTVGRIAAAAMLSCVLASAAATAQTAGPGAASPAPPPASPPPAGTAAPPSQPQGAADPFGTWFQQSGQMMQQGVANMGAGFGQMVDAISGQTTQATKDAADAARNAAVTVSKLPNSIITAGHEACVIAPNGAPDCRGAAATLCRAKGFPSGTSVDFVTIEICPPEYRASRVSAPEGVCTKEHYVTKALCQ